MGEIKRILKGFIKRVIKLVKKLIPRGVKTSIKKFIRNNTTYYFETITKTFYKPSFKKNHMEHCDKVHRQILEIEKNRDTNKKMSIVFICQFHAAWNACMSTFQAALSDPDIEVVLLALPDKIMKKGLQKKVSDIKAEEYGENIAYDYCKSFFPNTINAYNEEKGTWLDLKELKPDYVILSRSNQNYLPSQYRAKELAAYTKVCHIPYAYCKMNWDSRAVYRLNLTDYAYAIFTENQMYCDMLQKIFFGIFRADWKRIKFLGYPRFDLYNDRIKDQSKYQKTVLWLPRWVTESRLETSTFFKYKDVLIDFFAKHPDIQLICRPHPKMFGNFIATGEMTEEEVKRFKELFKETENFLLDEYSDYLPSFDKADIFISDTSSLLVEEFSTGKPIIFCGKMHFDKDAKKWAKYMYQVRSRKGLINQLTDLLDGNDGNRSFRENFIEMNMKYDGKSGQRIVDFLKEDYYKGSQEKMQD